MECEKLIRAFETLTKEETNLKKQFSDLNSLYKKSQETIRFL
jgi:hypothetical protein